MKGISSRGLLYLVLLFFGYAFPSSAFANNCLLMDNIDAPTTQGLLKHLNQSCLDQLSSVDYKKLITILVNERNDNHILQNNNYNDEAIYDQLILKTIDKYQENNDSTYSDALLELLDAQKLTKLQDYFDDDCTPLNNEKIKPIDEQAILYMHSLPSNRFLVLLITKEEVLVHYTNAKVIKVKVEDLRKAITSPALKDSLGPEKDNPALYVSLKSYSSSLYRMLLSPFSKKLQNLKHLVVVPDSSTGIFPMEALFDSTNNEYVIDKSYSVSYSPNLSRISKRTNKNKKLLFVSPDPVGTNSGPNMDLNLIKALFPSPSTVQGKEATKLGLFNAVTNKQVSILYIASHAEFKQSFEESFIQLSGDNTLKVKDFERVTSSLSSRILPPELIVLSACETAQGGNGDVDASLGLAGVAARSGANTVIASLWVIGIPEVLVGEINGQQEGSFFQIISDPTQKNIKTKAEALQESKRLRKKDRSIYDWAAFVLIGDWGVF